MLNHIPMSQIMGVSDAIVITFNLDNTYVSWELL